MTHPHRHPTRQAARLTGCLFVLLALGCGNTTNSTPAEGPASGPSAAEMAAADRDMTQACKQVIAAGPYGLIPEESNPSVIANIFDSTILEATAAAQFNPDYQPLVTAVDAAHTAAHDADPVTLADKLGDATDLCTTLTEGTP